METKKEYSLRSLGASNKKNLTYLSANVEHVVVKASRRLRKRNDLTKAALVGVRGSVTVTDERMNVVQLDAPYVIDAWVADDQLVTLMDVTSVSEGEVLLVDFRVRDSVFALLPGVERLSLQTLARVRDVHDKQSQVTEPLDLRELLVSTRGDSHASS